MRVLAICRALAAVAIVLAVSGCFRARVELTVGPDQHIDGTLLLAYDRAVLEQMERAPDDAQQEVLDDLTDVVLIVVGIVGVIVADRGPRPPPWRRERQTG